MDHQNALRFGSSSSSVSTGGSSQQRHHHHHNPHHHGIVGSYSSDTASGSLPLMQTFVNNINEQHKQHHHHHHQDQMIQHQTNDAADAAAAAAAAALHANNPMLTYYISHGSTSMPSQQASFTLYDNSMQHKDAAVAAAEAAAAAAAAAAQDLNFRSFSKAPEASGILEKPVKIKVQPSEGAHEGSDMETSASMAMAAFAASAAASALSSNPDPGTIDSQKTKILAHPYFPRLVQAYANCHKIGAPPEVVATLDEIIEQYQSFRHAVPGSVGEDPELDEFMSAYSEKLQKHHDELTESLEEARTFLKRMEIQLNTLTKDNQRIAEAGSTGKAGAVAGAGSGGGGGGGESSEDEEEEDGSCCDVDYHDMIDPIAEDSQLKQQLLRKYSSYMICSLKKEFLKRKKKGKLPKEARQKLLDWWTQHYKWPYPSENEKAALAEVTGLNQKQINNWFINQRKRHWKPSEDLQYVMVDANDLPAIQYPSLNANM